MNCEISGIFVSAPIVTFDTSRAKRSLWVCGTMHDASGYDPECACVRARIVVFVHRCGPIVSVSVRENAAALCGCAEGVHMLMRTIALYSHSGGAGGGGGRRGSGSGSMGDFLRRRWCGVTEGHVPN
jgi:hypothetical protein